MDMQTAPAITLSEAIDAIQRDAIVDDLKQTPIPPAVASHLADAQSLIVCVEVMATVLFADEFAKDSDDSYTGLNGYQRGAMLKGISTMLMRANASIHTFADCTAKRLGSA